MDSHIQFIGVLLIGLALAHLSFSKYFDWKEDLKSLSLVNRQMMKVHTFFIALIVLLMGILCFEYSLDIVGTALGKRICLGMAIFWTARLIIQFFGYSSELWKGKTFESIVHVLFTMLWTYLSWVFWSVYLL